jgi:hypothetical protein
MIMSPVVMTVAGRVGAKRVARDVDQRQPRRGVDRGIVYG